MVLVGNYIQIYKVGNKREVVGIFQSLARKFGKVMFKGLFCQSLKVSLALCLYRTYHITKYLYALEL